MDKIKSVDYWGLDQQYHNKESLMSKKLLLVNGYIMPNNSLLDIGVGTGEFVYSQREKFNYILGIDYDINSIKFCNERYCHYEHMNFKNLDVCDLQEDNKFDVITALDVLEHMPEKDVCVLMKKIYSLLNPGGTFIFTGPGIFNKISIVLKKDTLHLHSHSPVGWKKLIESSGLVSTNIECVEYPILDKMILRKKLPVFGKCCVIISNKK